jgi:hypothetical protein
VVAASASARGACPCFCCGWAAAAEVATAGHGGSRRWGGGGEETGSRSGGGPWCWGSCCCAGAVGCHSYCASSGCCCADVGPAPATCPSLNPGRLRANARMLVWDAAHPGAFRRPRPCLAAHCKGTDLAQRSCYGSGRDATPALYPMGFWTSYELMETIFWGRGRVTGCRGAACHDHRP